MLLTPILMTPWKIYKFILVQGGALEALSHYMYSAYAV